MSTCPSELLSHLNNVRGRLAGNPQSVSSHLQQLGMHLTSGRLVYKLSNLFVCLIVTDRYYIIA